jgi:hypothetical protein
MNKEQQDIILDVYREHCLEQSKYLTHGGTIQEFINKIKTDSEFSEKWGLKIEERGLSYSEREELFHQNRIVILTKGEKIDEQDFDNVEIPTKLITLEYKGIKIESYE